LPPWFDPAPRRKGAHQLKHRARCNNLTPRSVIFRGKRFRRCAARILNSLIRFSGKAAHMLVLANWNQDVCSANAAGVAGERVGFAAAGALARL